MASAAQNQGAVLHRIVSRLAGIAPGQALRILFGVASLATVAWITVPHLISTVSSNATINARVIPLITPIRGTMMLAPPEPGTVVKKDDLIAIIEDRGIDRMAIDRHSAEAEALIDRIATRKRTLGELEALKRTLERRRDDYQRANIARLEQELAAARALLRAAEAAAAEFGNRLHRVRSLRSKGVVSVAVLETADTAAQRTAEEVTQRQAITTRIAGELAALRDGVFASQNRNDVPYSQQRIDEITLRQVEVRTLLDEFAIRARELRSIIVKAEVNFAQRSRFKLFAPSTGVIWRTTIPHNGTVGANGRIGSLIDCSHLILNVVLHERHFEDIQPGDIATIKVIGSKVLLGRVESLRGMGASSENDLLAAEVPEIDNRHFLATLSIDGSGLTHRPNDFCHVGRSAEVLFHKSEGFFGRIGHLLGFGESESGQGNPAGAAGTAAARDRAEG